MGNHYPRTNPYVGGDGHRRTVIQYSVSKDVRGVLSVEDPMETPEEAEARVRELKRQGIGSQVVSRYVTTSGWN